MSIAANKSASTPTPTPILVEFVVPEDDEEEEDIAAAAEEAVVAEAADAIDILDAEGSLVTPKSKANPVAKPVKEIVYKELSVGTTRLVVPCRPSIVV